MDNEVINNILMVYSILNLITPKQKEKKKPKYRINPYLIERLDKGRFAVDFDDMRRNPSVFYENFHMDVEVFDNLFEMVEKHLLPKRNVRPDQISPIQKFAVTIEYLASGSLNRHLASVYRISKQHLGTIFDNVCSAIVEELGINSFDERKFLETAAGFQERWQFPNCLSAMDGKHVALKAPQQSGSAFYNYKGFHSIVLFAVADHKYKLIYYDVGAYGSEGDANIFANSDFGKAVTEEKLPFPQQTAVAGEMLPYFFIGDDAFPLGKRIMKPYSGRGRLTEEETIFNYRLSRARRCVENAFGILCSKWLCLKRTMFCSPDRAQKIVSACCALHNYLLEKTENYSPTLTEASDAVNIDGIGNDSMLHSDIAPYRGRQCDIGKRVREKLKSYVNSPEGSVEWQRKSTFLE